jgi:hypothetical protein
VVSEEAAAELFGEIAQGLFHGPLLSRTQYPVASTQYPESIVQTLAPNLGL